MTEHLTDQDCEALIDACEGAGEYTCCHRSVTRTTLGGVIPKGTPVGGAMLAAVEAIVRAHRAEALREAGLVSE